jgi:hypothetical protein
MTLSEAIQCVIVILSNPFFIVMLSVPLYCYAMLSIVVLNAAMQNGTALKILRLNVIILIV